MNWRSELGEFDKKVKTVQPTSLNLNYFSLTLSTAVAGALGVEQSCSDDGVMTITLTRILQGILAFTLVRAHTALLSGHVLEIRIRYLFID